MAKKSSKKDAKKAFQKWAAKAKKREWALAKFGIPDENRRQKMLEGNAKKLRMNMTSPEKKMEKLLKDMEVMHDMQKILGGFIYDFCIPEHRILIEVDGDYFHGHPDKYKKEDLNHLQKKIKRNDIQKDLMAKGCKYVLMRFWECDINDNIEEVKSRIAEHINKSSENGPEE